MVIVVSAGHFDESGFGFGRNCRWHIFRFINSDAIIHDFVIVGQIYSIDRVISKHLFAGR